MLINQQAKKVVTRIIDCSEGKYGYVLGDCSDCKHSNIIAHCGCGDRNCPCCGASQRKEWAEKISEKFIPERAFHVVFTLPHEFNALIKANKKPLLELLMKVAAATLLQFSTNSKHLGGTPFLMTVLHTWTQDLRFHPHVHALISSGALETDGKTWHEFKGQFLFSVKALASVFRGKFLAGLNELLRAGGIALLNPRQDETALMDFLANITKKWVVYCKPPYKNTDVVVRYFARYANRSAISNKRLLRFNDGNVSIAQRKDSAEPDSSDARLATNQVEMTGEKFLLRFVQHIPPSRMHRIRYYGLMSPKIRKEKRELLQKIIPRSPEEKKMAAQNAPPTVCPKCKSTNWTVLILRQNPKSANNPTFLQPSQLPMSNKPPRMMNNHNTRKDDTS